jgi:hypothetical protein
MAKRPSDSPLPAAKLQPERYFYWNPLPFWSIKMHHPVLWNDLIDRSGYHYFSVLPTNIIEYLVPFCVVEHSDLPDICNILVLRWGEIRVFFTMERGTEMYRYRTIPEQFCKIFYTCFTRMLPAQLFYIYPGNYAVAFTEGVRIEWIESVLRDAGLSYKIIIC